MPKSNCASPAGCSSLSYPKSFTSPLSVCVAFHSCTKLQTVLYDPGNPDSIRSLKNCLFVRRFFLGNLKSSVSQRLTISPHFSSYIIPDLLWSLILGTKSLSAYFFAVRQLIFKDFRIDSID